MPGAQTLPPRAGRAPEGSVAAVEGLLVLRDSPVHRLPAHTKLVSLVAFVLLVVLTPAGSWTAYAGYAALITLVVALARVPVRIVARRSLVEAPFVLFALVLPFVATGPTVAVGPMSLSEAGLVGAGTLLARATLGVVAAIVLAATTDPRELLAGLERLRLPGVLVAIVSFMVRYVAVVFEDLQRVRIARESRGGAGGGAGRLAAVAGGAATLFVRAFERGERVQKAMLARGYAGRMPALTDDGARPAQWVAAASLPLAAAAVLAASLARGLA